MQDDGEAGQTLGDFFQNVEAQCGGNQDALLVYSALLGSELVSAVGGADSDSQGVAAGAGNELFDFLRAVWPQAIPPCSTWLWIRA